jgi:hypothetical protein
MENRYLSTVHDQNHLVSLTNLLFQLMKMVLHYFYKTDFTGDLMMVTYFSIKFSDG